MYRLIEQVWLDHMAAVTQWQPEEVIAQREKKQLSLHIKRPQAVRCVAMQVRTRASCCLRSRGATPRCRQTQPSSARDKTIRSWARGGQWGEGGLRVWVLGAQSHQSTYIVKFWRYVCSQKIHLRHAKCPSPRKTLRCWFMQKAHITRGYFMLTF